MDASPEYKEINRLIDEGKSDQAGHMLSELLGKDLPPSDLWVLALSLRLTIQDPEHPLRRVIERCVSMLKTKFRLSKKVVPPDKDGQLSAEERVYGTVFREIFETRRGLGPDPFVIWDRIAPLSRSFDSNVTADQPDHFFNPALTLGVPYQLIRWEEWEEIEQYGEWEMFYRLYPHRPGILFLSDIEFNARRDQASVEIGHTTNFMAGWGRNFQLKKRLGGWKVENTKVTWRS